MISGSADFSAASAAALSPDAIASSTLRTEVRMRERRAVLTAVRRAITRAALRAEEVLAICRSVRAPRGSRCFQVLKIQAAARPRRRLDRLIKAVAGGVN